MAAAIILLGAGGTSLDVLDFLGDINGVRPTYECVGVLDDDRRKWGTIVGGVTVLGGLDSAHRWPEARFVDALGSPGSFWKREGIIARTGIAAGRFETVIHPSAQVSRRSTLGLGVIVYPHVVIGANVTVGDHAIVLANVVLNHEVSLGDYTIVASGVSVSGRVAIGRSCYLGAGSQIIQDASIGDNVLVGMGSVVLRDVPPGIVVAGNPARRIRDTIEPAPAAGAG